MASVSKYGRSNMSKKSKISKSSNPPGEKDDRVDPSSLPGWPGYRTREGRTGYDPIDTRTEAAHTFGTFVQSLFTGRLKIENPVLLLLSGVLGLIFILPLVLAVLELINGNPFSWDAWIYLLIAGMTGVALLVNFIKNLTGRRK
jgi:hypothetical protein